MPDPDAMTIVGAVSAGEHQNAAGKEYLTPIPFKEDPTQTRH
jgi:hypothetical protein